MKKAETGNSITVHYTGKFEDGQVFDTSLTEGREPLTTVLSEDTNLIKGFTEALYGLTEGEKKTVELTPADAYGEVLEDLISDVPLENMPEGVKVGDMLQAQGPNGVFNVVVVEVNETTAKVDANHPLAGKKLIFDLEVVSID
jgi:FKBP-type peptidyl-prolyl cis-trans isomerase 2